MFSLLIHRDRFIGWIALTRFFGEIVCSYSNFKVKRIQNGAS